jgi:hypothetical protein
MIQEQPDSLISANTELVASHFLSRWQDIYPAWQRVAKSPLPRLSIEERGEGTMDKTTI